MYKHILLPTDGSKLSNTGVKEAIKLAAALRARITALHVVGNYRQHIRDAEEGYMIPEMQVFRKDFEKRAAAHAKKILDQVKAAAAKAGVKCGGVVATGDFPYEMIIKQARKSKCDLIMMASHGRSGIKGLLLGSETVKVLTHSKIPVLVVR